jgi:hypothetical protein
MRTYLFEKDGKYLKEDGTFTTDISQAKEIKLKWWEWMFKILILLIQLYGNGTLKLKK